jgi:hypothetical protein
MNGYLPNEVREAISVVLPAHQELPTWKWKLKCNQVDFHYFYYDSERNQSELFSTLKGIHTIIKM